MRRAHLWVILMAAVLATVSTVVADDLALISISSQAAAETATRIVGHAYAKSGDRFLVSTTADTRDSLRHYGIPYDILVTDTRPELYCLVHSSDRQIAPQSSVELLGRSQAIGDGLFIVETTPAAAAAIGQQEHLFVVPLSGRTIQIHYLPPAVPFRFEPNDVFPTDTIINRIRKDSIMAWDKKLEAFYTRYIWSDSTRKAREWMISKFQQWGYTQITTPSFTYGGGTLLNLKVVKPGYAEPDKVIVVGGHYDAINFESPGYAFSPGADDDASGVAVTMELARIMANIPMRKTIVFMPFNAEEVGLVGSAAAAADFRSAGTLLEAMFNYDMVAFTGDDYWDFDLSSGPNTAYRTLSADAATRLTTLIPNITAMGTSSDHYSFHEQGYNVVDNIEGDFNTAGWHTNLDLSSRLNFDYFTEVVKMAAASVAIAANSAYPVTVNQIVDVGDGAQLQVHITPCNTGCQYTIYYGTTPGTYTDSVTVPLGSCSQVISGLSEGVTYYFAAYGKPTNGYRALWAGEGSERPLITPRAPTALLADPGFHLINLDWKDNTEADMASYNVYRRIAGQPQFELYREGLTASAMVDSGVASGLLYQYVITAVDQTGHESAYSGAAEAYPATFDAGVLIVDENTQDYGYFPDEAHQAAYFDTVLGGLTHAYVSLNNTPDSLTKSQAGRQSSIIWDDDDIFNKILSGSKNTLTWYLGNQVNMMVCGYKTVQRWCPLPIPTNHLLYSEFMTSGYDYTNTDYFASATGQNGWPSIQWDQTRGIKYYYECPVLALRPGATPILLNVSPTGNYRTDGKPVAMAYDGPHGKRVLLAVPLYYLTPASANAFMAKVLEFFGESTRPIPGGDNNGSGFVDLSDLSTLVSYLTGGGGMLIYPNGADVDHSCNIDLSDLSRLVAYLVTGKPDLVQGCVTP
ncbi:hypothetical protein C3F09_07425 [candidate division GN15 bacterium]|uniref:Peptidase M28 domain-containing protein n=1 Tax=candidate division GN15 bacterium TaxID=2072418 RepID=A0A855X034_9BACT|nr:MAG: hypothetical protein C3F09_07425 [candidate division GN15 bacterium]